MLAAFPQRSGGQYERSSGSGISRVTGSSLPSFMRSHGFKCSCLENTYKLGSVEQSISVAPTETYRVLNV